MEVSKRASSRKKTAYLLLSIMLIFLCPSIAHADDWNMWGHDSQHTSYSTENIDLPLKLLWKTEIEGPIYSSPVVSGDLVYVGSSDYYLHTFEAKTGDKKFNYESFKYPLYATAASTPLVTDNSIYTSSYDDRVYAYYKKGELKWKYCVGRATYSSPAIHNETIYIGTRNGICAFGKDDGSLKWEYETTGMVYSSPAVSENGVYVASTEGKVYALDINTGHLIWKFKTAGKITSSPAIDQQTLFLGSFDKNIYAIDKRSGKVKWKYETGDEIRSSPAINNNSIYIGSKDGYIYSLEKETSRLKWKYETGDEIISSPALAGNYLFIASMDGNLYVFNAEDGTLKDKIGIGAGTKASLAIKDNIVYLLSEDDELYALSVNGTKFLTPEQTQQIIGINAKTSDPQNKTYFQQISGSGSQPSNNQLQASDQRVNESNLTSQETQATIGNNIQEPPGRSSPSNEILYGSTELFGKIPIRDGVLGVLFIFLIAISSFTLKTKNKKGLHSKEDIEEQASISGNISIKEQQESKLKDIADENSMEYKFQKHLKILQTSQLWSGGPSKTMLDEAQRMIDSADFKSADYLLRKAEEIIEKENEILIDITNLHFKTESKDIPYDQEIGQLLGNSLNDLKKGFFDYSQLYLENAKKVFEKEKKH
ncbi:hypothetical protein MCMEM_1824 [Methanococcoides methylutens MM1]|uniref:Pyrrolo-quinoline quinone repeat domain-containing protein n=1 Tax=Methanococcoides methylutens MM1 TaxID=1434104 RepID=A0A0E3STE2_METMT|nr:hypothetical protein MCMEM_1824 [Methanococcoides methylutens MM1]